MSQEIKIPVTAKTDAGEAAIRKVGDAAGAVAQDVKRIATEAKAATRDLNAMEAAARRLAHTREILSREFGRQVSQGDAQTFLGNFDRMRAGKGLGSKRLKTFNDFDDWYKGHGASFAKATSAAHHRRFIMAAAMQGTEHVDSFGAPPPYAGGAGAGGGGSGGFGVARRAGTSAWGFVRGGMALAGIGTAMGTAAAGVSSAKEEAIGIDTLKRLVGDLGADFSTLRERARAAADGLGVTYVESMRYTQGYAKEAGNLRGDDRLDGVRAGVGMSRAFGLDPEAGVGFFGTMRRTGVASDESSQRRLAATIGEAVARGGYMGKADEVLAAVASFASLAARAVLSTPNVGAYAGALSSLTGTGRPGLDPSGASSILGAADASIRGGGGMGEAGMNFVYAALRGVTPDPLLAKALWSGGLFATTRNTFGLGAGGEGLSGADSVELSDTTNFQRIRDLINSQVEMRYRAEVAQNLFGLQSPQQAWALLGTSDATHNEANRLADLAGVTPTASSMANIGMVAGTSSVSALREIFEGVERRADLTEADRGAMKTALDSGSVEAIKVALVGVLGTKEMEVTEGDKTRRSIAELENAVTGVGEDLLTPLNAIRTAVVAIAEKLAPRRMEQPALDAMLAGEVDLDAKALAARPRAYGNARAMALGEYRRAKARANGGPVDIDSIQRAPRAAWDGDPYWQETFDQWMGIRQVLQRLESPATPSTPGGVSADAAWANVAGGGSALSSEAISAIVLASVPGARMTSGRRTAAQNTAAGGVVNSYHLTGQAGDFVPPAGMSMEEFHRRIAGSLPPHLEALNHRDHVHVEPRPGAATMLGATPLPGGAGASAGSAVNVNIGAPQEILLRDAETRKPRGTINLRPHVQPTPAGVN